MIPDHVKWYGSRAHWREKKYEKSHHCRSVIGKLYDGVLSTNEKMVYSYTDAMAIRFRDRYGKVLACPGHNTKGMHQNMYQTEVPQRLGWNQQSEDIQERMKGFASNQLKHYEPDIWRLMNKYNIRNEGELFTGCFCEYHKERQYEICEEVRRQAHDLCKFHRKNLSRHSLHHYITPQSQQCAIYI
jgi:hypothetical protein